MTTIPEMRVIPPEEMSSILEDAREMIRLLRTGDKWKQAAKRLACKSFSAGLSIEMPSQKDKTTA